MPLPAARVVCKHPLRNELPGTLPESGCSRVPVPPLSVLAALAAVVAAVPACNRKDGKIKIGVVTNCTDPFWDLCEAGAKKAAQDFDVNVLFRQPEKLDAASRCRSSRPGSSRA